MEALLGDTGRRTTAVASPAASRQREAALQPVAVHGSATPPEEAEMQALLEDLDGHPRRESGDNGAPRNQDERRDRADAQRFASLLVSEMMLYNEDAVILGRKHRDLHKRLQKEIERSRRAYAARVPAQLVASTNYLEEEMVRVLADGDRRLLAG
jgi:hypothetical protein